MYGMKYDPHGRAERLRVIVSKIKDRGSGLLAASLLRNKDQPSSIKITFAFLSFSPQGESLNRILRIIARV